MIYMEDDDEEDILSELEEIRFECRNSDNQAEADTIHGCCRRIEDLLDSLHESDEDEDLRDMIPENLSVGAAISLKETLNKWRSENGYHEL